MAEKRRVIRSHIPEDITSNYRLNEAIKALPHNYNFEIHKTVWKIRSTGCKRVALQFPEGLLMFACAIADILEEFTDAEMIIMGDVTYGACCIDDFTAIGLGCDLMVHYGHSCLVPISTTTGIQMLYVFVDIKMHMQHLLDTIRYNFKDGSHLAVISTVQFVTTLQLLRNELGDIYSITIPQAKPLSPGEVLGCTAPKVAADVDALLYVGDGRFHLEAAMIANPSVDAYRYDPYSKKLTREHYDYKKMTELRQNAVLRAISGQTFGLILGTLGRQGNPRILMKLEERLAKHGKQFIHVLLSEIFPDKLNQFEDVDVWVQIACPRLSIDWGEEFSKPVLTPYEVCVALNEIEWQGQYPMDYYAYDSLGPWTNNHTENQIVRKRNPVPRKHVKVELSE